MVACCAKAAAGQLLPPEPIITVVVIIKRRGHQAGKVRATQDASVGAIFVLAINSPAVILDAG